MKKLLIILAALIVTACGSFKSVTQTEAGTFLQLVGNTENALLVLDGNNLDLNSTQSFDLNGKQVTKISIPKGQHRVTISRDGTLLVDRNIFVSEGNAFEITLP